MLLSSRVSRKRSIFVLFFLSSSLGILLNRDMNRFINRNGADVIALHHGAFCLSFIYWARGIAAVFFCSCTFTSKSRIRNGVELTTIGYMDGYIASLSTVEGFILASAMPTNAPIPKDELLRAFSGAIRIVAVYSFGMLMAMIIPITVPIPQAIRRNLLDTHTFRNNICQSVSTFSGRSILFSSCKKLLFISINTVYKKRFQSLFVHKNASFFFLQSLRDQDIRKKKRRSDAPPSFLY